MCVCCACQVTFVNAQGLPEAGLDHGGLMKELLEQVVQAGTQPEYGLLATTEDSGLLYPNPTAEAIPQGLALLEFLGLFDTFLFMLCTSPHTARQNAVCRCRQHPALSLGIHTTMVTSKRMFQLCSQRASASRQICHVGISSTV